MPALRLYDYAASCNAYKVRLLIAQLGLDVERVEVDIFAGETMTDDYKSLNPARTVPVLELADGRTLPESGAILWHLADGSPLLPADSWTRAQVMRWLLFEQADLLPATGGLRFLLQTGRWDAVSPPAQARHAAGVEVLGMLDEHLRDRAFVVGDTYTIADVALYGYTHVAHEAGLAMHDFPHIQAWLDSVAAQPGHMNDVVPYPPNARAGMGRSLYG
jgi:glutathione S-transferase